MIQESDEKILKSSVDENRLKITTEIMRYMPILWSKLTEVKRSNPGDPRSEMYGPYDSIKISFKTKDRSDESIYVTIPDDLWVHMDWTVSANETSWASVILDKIVAYMSKRHYNLEDFKSIKSMLLWRQGPSVTKTHLLANHLSDIYDTAGVNAAGMLDMLDKLGIDQADLENGTIKETNDSFHFSYTGVSHDSK